VSTQQKAVLKIIRNLAVFNCLIIVAMGVYAMAPCDAIERDDSVVADLGPGHHPGRIAGNIHPRCRDWSSCSCEAGRVANTAFRRGRSRIDRCVVLGQDRNSDPQ
jgi:hypothetical protein